MESQVRDCAPALELSASKSWESCKLSISAREKVRGLFFFFFYFNHIASSRLRSGITHTTQGLAESTWAESSASPTRKPSQCASHHSASVTEAFFENLSSGSNSVPI